ncbi:FliM/FliN family flagellar motor switch protein [Hydrogenothermus marinus]|nr:FliM/FliN family flagellar motor switch protein [Hydrogenothermus marinus]
MEENKNLESLEEGMPQDKDENPEAKDMQKFKNLDLDFLSDISLKITVEIGRSRKMFLDILKLKEGDIIKLNKHLEDYIDIYINDTRFFIGELVVVNEKYSVRIIDLV